MLINIRKEDLGRLTNDEINYIKSDSVGVGGFAVIEIESKDANGSITRMIKPNTVTEVGKMSMLSRSASDILMRNGGTLYGDLQTVDTLGGMTTNQVYNMYAKPDIGLNNYLLKLDGVVMDKNSKLVNILKEDFTVDDTKLIGMANNRIVTGNNKEGITDFCLGQYMIDGVVIANRWKYAENVAVGNFNYLVMAPGIHGDLKCNGISSKKCISKLNEFEQNNVYGGMFIIPGAGSITSPTQVLLNDSRHGVGRWLYDFVTGEHIPVPDGSIAKSVPMYATFDQIVHEGYLYLLTRDKYIRKIDMITGLEVANRSLGGSFEVGCGGSFLSVGTDLYVMGSYNSNDGQYDNFILIDKLNLSNLSSASSSYKVNSPLLGGVPSGYNKNRLVAKKCNGLYYVNFNAEVIVCTDLTNIKGTRVGSYLASPDVHYVNVGGKTKTIELGVNGINIENITSNRNNDVYTSLTNKLSSKLVYNEGVSKTIDYNKKGIWVGDADWNGNLLSFIKLAEPGVTKGANDIIYVSYGYKFI